MTTGIGKNDQGLPEDAPRAWARWSRRAQSISAVLWPSFLAAALATGLFFGNVEPAELASASLLLTDMSVEGMYALGFFFFWLVCAVSSLVSVFLIRTSRRPDGTPRGPHH